MNLSKGNTVPFIKKKWKPSKCQAIGKQLDQLWDIHRTENCSVVKDDDYIENVVMQGNVNTESGQVEKAGTPASSPRSECQQAYIHVSEAGGINEFKVIFSSSPENGLTEMKPLYLTLAISK